jgi:hypothetical protein
VTDRNPALGDFVTAASLWIPSFINGSAWIGHAPFLFWLLEQLAPSRFVELGTHQGYSYFAACEGVRRLGLRTQCFAVDHWQGDEHAGTYAGTVFRDVKSRNEAYFGDISRLIRASFSDALPYIEDGSVDLLHVDGRHFYEDVKSDFESWRQKLSERAIVLFHDTMVRERGFGVYRYWAELRRAHPGFEFHHSHGLGVLCIGSLPPGPLGDLLRLAPESAAADDVRACYRRLGASISDRREAEQVGRLESEVGALKLTEKRIGRVEAAVTRGTAASVAKLAEVARQTKDTGKTVAKLLAAEKERRQPATLWERIRGEVPPASPERKRKAPRPGKKTAPPPEPAPPPPSFNGTETRMMEALALGRAEGWMAAEPDWRALWLDRPLPDPVAVRKLLPPDPAPAGAFEDVTPRTPGESPPLKWCIYTTLFGHYDTLQPVLARPAGLTCVCFADHDVAVEGWTTIRVPPASDPLRAAKAYKMLPFEHLADYDASLFVDANTLIHGDIVRFVARWCAHEPFVMWRHGQRGDVYDEAEAILVKQKSEPLPVLRQVARYEAEGMPRQSGVVAAGFIWRHHRSEAVRALMTSWSEETARESARDQLSLAYVLWKSGIRPKVLPDRLGTCWSNPVTSITPHRAMADTASPGLDDDRTAVRPPTGARRKVAFLYDRDSEAWGTTMMRGFQLSQLVSRHLGDRFDVSYLPRSESPTDSILILAKGCIARATPEELRELRARNIAIVADFVDGTFRTDILSEVDLVWASSIAAHRSLLLQKLPVASDMVTHHVDPRIAPQPRPDGFSVAYFGELVNAVKNEAIEKTVRFHAVDTRVSSTDWLPFAGMFAMHYAVRPEGEGKPAHKPFLKGFTAARCHANIIVDRQDGDAVHYLGDDYPYLTEAPTPAEALRVLEVARATYGSDTWRQGLEVMDYVRSVSSDAYVAGEVLRSLRRF